MKILWKVVIIFFLSGRVAHAVSYSFDFNPERKILSDENTVNLTFVHNLNKNELGTFVVRPKCDECAVWILNNETWASSTDLWNKMPPLTSHTKIKISPSNRKNENIYFQIQNTKLSTVYETPKHVLWNSNYNKNYIRSINQNLQKLEKGSLENLSPIKEKITLNTKSIIENKPSNAVIAMSIGISFLSTILGFSFDRLLDKFRKQINALTNPYANSKIF